MTFFNFHAGLSIDKFEISGIDYTAHLSINKTDKVQLVSISYGRQKKDLLTDSLISYFNQQDWAYLKAENDWGWHGELILLFNKKGLIKRVKSDFHSGYTHQNDINLRSADKLSRQVRKMLKKGDFTHLNPPSEYRIAISLTYTTATRKLVWNVYVPNTSLK